MVRFHPHPPNKELIMGTLVVIGIAFLVGYILPRPEWAKKVYEKILAKIG